MSQGKAPLCWKSNNPRARAPWRNYLPYESMAKSKCFWQNRIALTLWPFLQINPEKMTSLQMCRIKKITPCSIQTFWDRQLCFYVKKLFVREKTPKSELCQFSKEIYVIKFCHGRICSSSNECAHCKIWWHKSKVDGLKSLITGWRYFFDSTYFKGSHFFSSIF